MFRKVLMIALLVLNCSAIHAGDTGSQEQAYKGGKITLLGVERASVYGRDGDAWFWYEPGSAGDELVVVKLKVSLGAGSISFKHKDVKLLDAKGKKHDWRKVVTVTQAQDFSGNENITREGWDRMTVLVDPTQGMVYIDEKNGRMHAGTERDITKFLFSVPRGTEVTTLEINKLRFELSE